MGQGGQVVGHQSGVNAAVLAFREYPLTALAAEPA
jgi:hypothetical protein